MLTDLALYAANRAANGAVGSMTRWAAWAAIAALFLTCAVIFAAVAAYQSLAPVFGTIGAAGLVAGGALAIALSCLAAPALMDVIERQAAERARTQAGPVASSLEAANKETEAAVDYFGPLQVLTAAFLVGLRTGRQVTERMRA